MIELFILYKGLYEQPFLIKNLTGDNMDLTLAELKGVHSSFRDMCMVRDVMTPFVNYAFHNQKYRQIHQERPTVYPRKLMQFITDLGIYSEDLRFFHTFQVLRQLQPTTKGFSYSIGASDSVEYQAKMLLGMLDAAIPLTTFTEDLKTLDDTKNLPYMKNLRLEKMVKKRHQMEDDDIFKANFINYKVLNVNNGRYGRYNVNNKINITKIFNDIDKELDTDYDLIDTETSFDREKIVLEENDYRNSLIYNAKKQTKISYKNKLPLYILCLIIFILFCISFNIIMNALL